MVGSSVNFTKIALFLFLFFSLTHLSYSTWSRISLTNVPNRGTYPNTLIELAASRMLINITHLKNCNISSAILELNMKPSIKNSDSLCIVPDFNESYCIPLLPPRYVNLNFTEVLKEALRRNLDSFCIVIKSVPGPGYNFLARPRDDLSMENFLYADNITKKAVFHLDVMCNKSLPGEEDVNSSVILDKYYSKDGDTLLVWNDTFIVFDHNDVNLSEYLDKAKWWKIYNPHEIKYRIYRSKRPITSETINEAELIDEVDPINIWMPYFWGGEQAWITVVKKLGNYDALVPRMPTDDEVLANYNQHVYVIHNYDEGDYYYAITKVIDGQEDFSDLILGKNSLGSPIHEKPGPGLVLIRNHTFEDSFLYVSGPIERWYLVKWSFPPNESNYPRPFNYVVRISRNPNHQSITGENRSVFIGLHCWGGRLDSGYLWWWDAERGSILVATNQNPYDWWPAYNEYYSTLKSYKEGKVYPYTENRIWNFVKYYVAKKWKINFNRIFLGGNSMGGSGTIMWGVRNPDKFAFLVGKVGVYIPSISPQFKSSFENVYGAYEWNVTYDGTNLSSFDYWNTSRYLYENRNISIPWAVFANGRNDRAIGWEQAWYTVKTMIDTKQPFVFKWGLNRHEERMAFPCGGDRVPTIIIYKNQSLPAFTNGSLDTPLGSNPDEAPDSGKINYYYMWKPESIVDKEDRWEITIYLCDKAPKYTAYVDITPRRLQNFKVEPGQYYYWRNIQDDDILQEGCVKADDYGLITIPRVIISKGENRIIISKTPFNISLGRSSDEWKKIVWIQNKMQSYNITVYGGISPYTFEIIEGQLPEGIHFDTSNGIIYGKTNEKGCYELHIKVMDSQNSEAFGKYLLCVYPQRKDFEIEIPAYNNSLIVSPDNSSDLPDIIANLKPNTVVYFLDGTYKIGKKVLEIKTPNVTLISLSHNMSSVVLDGEWITDEYIQIYAENVTVAY